MKFYFDFFTPVCVVFIHYSMYIIVHLYIVKKTPKITLTIFIISYSILFSSFSGETFFNLMLLHRHLHYLLN